MRRGIFGLAGLIILAAVIIVAYLSIYVVDPTKQALVLRFGQTVRATEEPGLYFKIPFIDNVVFIEKRLLDLDSPPLEIIASDQKRLVVDAFARYRVINSLLFYQSVGNVTLANSRLAVILNSAVRRVLGEATFTDVVRDIRTELMERITAQVSSEAAGLGIEVVDVRIRRADLPEANSQAIYDRMETERQQEAAQIRAEGEEAARRITAVADRDATSIVATANQQGESIRGEGDAEANRVFAIAFSADPDFFSFYRSMIAYQESLTGNTTTLLLSPNSEFFRFFGDIHGGSPAGGITPSALDQILLPDLNPAPVDAAAPPAETPAPAVETPAAPGAETPLVPPLDPNLAPPVVPANP